MKILAFIHTKRYVLMSILMLGIRSPHLHGEAIITAPEPTSAIPQETNLNNNNEVWVNIFVHGILSIQPHLSVANLFRLMFDKVDDTVYAKAVGLMRRDPFFGKNQAMQGLGLVPVNLENRMPGNSSGALARLFGHMERLSNIDQATNLYYTYGWSGILSNSHRYRDAVRFFYELETLEQQLRAQHKKFHIRIITYSHGGNVALNLAMVRNTHRPDSTLHINELVMIGLPILRENDCLVRDELFGHIFNLYSEKDRIQALDFFNPSRTFSKRRFETRCSMPHLPNKLYQVEIKITRHRQDIKKGSKRAEATYDFENKSIISGTHPYLRDMSPGHSEIWYFGWTPKNYRTQLPLYPLPAISLFPFIRKHVLDKKDQLSPLLPLIVDVRPENGVILFKHQTKRALKLVETTPYLSPEHIRQIGGSLFAFAPERYTPERYHRRVHKNIRRARAIMSAEKTYKNNNCQGVARFKMPQKSKKS